MTEPVQDQLIDPVCGMHMIAEESPAVATYCDHSYYFCSDTHKEAFLHDPEKYLKKLHDEGKVKD